MAGASSRAHARYHTEPLNPQAPAGDEGAVTRLRIVNVGRTSSAARSGGTLQLDVTVQPVHDSGERSRRPQVIYARPVVVEPVEPVEPVEAPRPRPSHQRPAWTTHDAAARVARAVPTERFERFGYQDPRQQIAAMQERVLRAFSGLQGGMPAQQLARRWSTTPSTVIWSVAVGVYALALFLFALFSS